MRYTMQCVTVNCHLVTTQGLIARQWRYAQKGETPA